MPGKQDRAKYILSEFLKYMEKSGVKALKPDEIFQATKQITSTPLIALKSHVYFTNKGFLNVHVWQYPNRGFWGINKGIVEIFNILEEKMGIPSYFVFLLGRLEDGKLNETNFVADGYIIRKIEPPYINIIPTVASDGDYRIYEDLHMNKLDRILSLSEVVKKIKQLDCSIKLTK